MIENIRIIPGAQLNYFNIILGLLQLVEISCAIFGWLKGDFNHHIEI